MISKFSVILQKICVFLSGAGCLVCFALPSAHSSWRIVFVVALVVSSIWHVNNTKCPHCNRHGGLKPNPFAKDAGKCIHCGQQVDYK